MSARPGSRGSDRRSEIEIEEELKELEEQVGSLTAGFDDFADWYAQLRRRYGRPSDEARAALLDGDFAAFEQLVRDGR